MNTETLDKLYLEWSQFTNARTERELQLIEALDRLSVAVGQNLVPNNMNPMWEAFNHARVTIECARKMK